MKRILLLLGVIVGLAACDGASVDEGLSQAEFDALYAELQADESLQQATFAGGCFWCTEAVLQELPGVVEAVSGYAGGEEEYPTYAEVVADETGHREAVRVYYRADEISYEQLLDAYWNSIDPTDDGGQFTDRGFNYTTAVFYASEGEREAAESDKEALEAVTEILPLTTFYPAEAFHQDFYQHSAQRYERYKNGSGRSY